ncbi:unnamed protein product [Prorocentrum cordatum]|uniref:Uncharacterized protein n=1 Tax=Prorocentrum cordatum TaxID=2364126 RepID=A0ABN9V2I7_9DINO|nr:unnamed protein product [Polarella glacialis]
MFWPFSANSARPATWRPDGPRGDDPEAAVPRGEAPRAVASGSPGGPGGYAGAAAAARYSPAADEESPLGLAWCDVSGRRCAGSSRRAASAGPPTEGLPALRPAGPGAAAARPRSSGPDGRAGSASPGSASTVSTPGCPLGRAPASPAERCERGDGEAPRPRDAATDAPAPPRPEMAALEERLAAQLERLREHLMGLPGQLREQAGEEARLALEAAVGPLAARVAELSGRQSPLERRLTDLAEAVGELRERTHPAARDGAAAEEADSVTRGELLEVVDLLKRELRRMVADEVRRAAGPSDQGAAQLAERVSASERRIQELGAAVDGTSALHAGSLADLSERLSRQQQAVCAAQAGVEQLQASLEQAHVGIDGQAEAVRRLRDSARTLESKLDDLARGQRSSGAELGAAVAALEERGAEHDERLERLTAGLASTRRGLEDQGARLERAVDDALQRCAAGESLAKLVAALEEGCAHAAEKLDQSEALVAAVAPLKEQAVRTERSAEQPGQGRGGPGGLLEERLEGLEHGRQRFDDTLVTLEQLAGRIAGRVTRLEADAAAVVGRVTRLEADAVAGEAADDAGAARTELEGRLHRLEDSAAAEQKRLRDLAHALRAFIARCERPSHGDPPRAARRAGSRSEERRPADHLRTPCEPAWRSPSPRAPDPAAAAGPCWAATPGSAAEATAGAPALWKGEPGGRPACAPRIVLDVSGLSGRARSLEAVGSTPSTAAASSVQSEAEDRWDASGSRASGAAHRLPSAEGASAGAGRPARPPAVAAPPGAAAEEEPCRRWRRPLGRPAAPSPAVHQPQEPLSARRRCVARGCATPLPGGSHAAAATAGTPERQGAPRAD